MDDEAVELLRSIAQTQLSIDRRLALQTLSQERDLRQRLMTDLLKTKARIAMWEAIDGRRGSPDIAREANASERAAQMFIKELLDLKLAQVVRGTTGRGFIVEKDEDAIVQWYADRGRE